MAKCNTAKQFLEATYHKKYDMDNWPKTGNKYQCWDYGDFFWLNQVGRSLSTGGTGCARGCWTIASARKANAGKEFDLITDKKALKIGDWVILNCGSFGHVAMVQEIGKKGVRIKLQGQNQGKILTWTNRVWFSLDTFLGAFRYKNWTKATKKATYTTYKVKKGDTLTKIAKKFKTTVKKLQNDNAIENPNKIFVGQKIIIK